MTGSTSWKCGLLAGVVIVLLGLFWRSHTARHFDLASSANDKAARARLAAPEKSAPENPRLHSPPGLAPTASEIVGVKLAEFAQSRRRFALALAQRHQVEISADVERFFDAVEGGKWPEIEAAFKKINGDDSSAGHNSKRAPELTYLWPAIIDAFGVAEQVHEWPAQKLLDYGSAILGSLSPGMVYVGGTDSGRWIPELLNETSDGERHVVVTQNGLADGTYQDYLRLQYDDRLTNLTDEDSQRAFGDYLTDARKRFDHDQQFPDEPKQVRPHEELHLSDGKFEVSGQTAVMSVNENLLQALMAKNPETSFAIQESFPLKGTYADAVPLGPLMELRANENFTAERAAQSVAYWQSTATQVIADPEAANSPEVLKSYSHDAVAAANLLAAHSFSSEAEQAYRLAGQLWPENPDLEQAPMKLIAPAPPVKH